jgi:hypothetical protein
MIIKINHEGDKGWHEGARRRVPNQKNFVRLSVYFVAFVV